MYMCYLDESGVQENASTSHFVLLGLAVVAEQWKPMEGQITACKAKYGLQDAEVHTAWMARRYVVEQERIPGFEALGLDERRRKAETNGKNELIRIAALGDSRRLKNAKKNYRMIEPYLHLTLSERHQLLRDLAEIIASWQDARLFAEAVDKRHVYGKATLPYPPFEYAFTELVQRYEYFLRNRGRFLDKPLDGIIVQDNNETVARKLTSMMRRFHSHGTRWTDIDHIIETPLYVDSQLTSMVQLADLCGYATRRFFENNETDLFDRVYPRFDRSNMRVVGIRHCTSQTCPCKVCKDH